MSMLEPKAVLQRVFKEFLNAHNPAVYKELYGDMVYHAPATGDLKGEAHRQFMVGLLTAFPDSRYNVEDMIVAGDKVVTRWSLTGTHKGTFMGVPPTGKTMTSAGTVVDRVVNGKIVEEWSQWDTLGMMQQLGLVPEVKVATPVAA
jgi:steroid delta-isomerase-like uncharacterized protein